MWVRTEERPFSQLDYLMGFSLTCYEESGGPAGTWRLMTECVVNEKQEIGIQVDAKE